VLGRLWSSGYMPGAFPLVPGAPQRSFQSHPFLVPIGIFSPRFSLECLDLGFDGRGSLRMLPLSFVKRRFRLIDGPLSPFTLLLQGSLFPCPFVLAVLLLAFISQSDLALRRLVDGAGGGLPRLAAFRLAGAFRGLPALPRSVGSSACSRKDPSKPTGRLRTMPGFAMVAAMTLGSSLSFAAPW
jgi:hypothetical protein